MLISQKCFPIFFISQRMDSFLPRSCVTSTQPWILLPFCNFSHYLSFLCFTCTLFPTFSSPFCPFTGPYFDFRDYKLSFPATLLWTAKMLHAPLDKQLINFSSLLCEKQLQDWLGFISVKLTIMYVSSSVHFYMQLQDLVVCISVKLPNNDVSFIIFL